MNGQIAHDTFHQAVMWHGLDMLPRLRQMTYEERRQVTHEANEHNLIEPLWLMAGEPVFDVPSWDKEPLTGAQVTALLVFGLWVQLGENELMASGLLRIWPEIKIACVLAAKGANRTAGAVCL